MTINNSVDSIIQGILNGSGAPAGVVGEVIFSIKSSGSSVALTNNILTQVTSITLTPGIWMVWGNISITTNTGSISYITGSVNTAVSAVDFSESCQVTGVTTSNNDGVICPIRYLPSASSQTAYLLTAVGFTAAASACGGIYGLRIA